MNLRSEKMNTPVTRIRPVKNTDKEAWLTMWEAYLAFYNQSLDADITEQTWHRFFDEGCPLYCLTAEKEDGALLGFAAYVVHPGTWGKGNVCYLEDLYVAPEARCRGVARKMIGQLIEQGKQEGWFRLYWHTDDGNHTARALYDKIGTLSDRVKYDVAL